MPPPETLTLSPFRLKKSWNHGIHRTHGRKKMINRIGCAKAHIPCIPCLPWFNLQIYGTMIPCLLAIDHRLYKA